MPFAMEQGLASRAGQSILVPAERLEALQAQLRGRLLSPADSEYETARRVWNGMVNRRPGLIARCLGTADVIRALAFAREHDLLLSVRGGGHNIAGSALCDGGLVLDLSLMKGITVDPQRRRVHIQPGATLGEVDHETQSFGLAAPLGINSTTGVAGLTLGGGFGWLSRKYGLTVDNLVSADVVTGDGRFLRVSAQENEELFWGIRGGGGNFGIVTRFELQLHPVGPEVMCGLVFFPYAQGAEVLAGYRELSRELGDESAVWGVLRRAPPLPFLPEATHGKEVVALALLCLGSATEAQGLIDRVHALGKPVGEHVGSAPFVAWQQTFDPLLTPGARNYWKSHNYRELSDGAQAVMLEYAGRLPSLETEIFLGQLGGAVNRVAADATAYAHRDIEYVMNVHGRWELPEQDAECIGWARQFFAAAAPFAAGGVYVNFMTEEESDRVRLAYGSNYERLVQLKNQLDPQNLFRSNQNIEPTSGALAAELDVTTRERQVGGAAPTAPEQPSGEG